MTDRSNEVARKLKDAMAVFESPGRPQEGDFKPRKNNVQCMSPVAKAGLSNETERQPRPKNWGANVQPATQTSDYRSQLKGSGVQQNPTSQNDFRAHLKPAQCKPKTDLDISLSADSKTEKRIEQTWKDSPKASGTLPINVTQVFGKVKANSQEAGSISPKEAEFLFKKNLDKVLSGKSSPTPRTGQFSPPPPPPPFGKSSKTTTQSTAPSLPSASKGTTSPFRITPEAPAPHAQRKPIGNLAIPKPPSDESRIVSNNANLAKLTTDSTGKSNSHQKTTPTQSPTSPESRPVVAYKPNTNAVPQPPMPKTGQTGKVIASAFGKTGNWKAPSSSTQSNHSPKTISRSGKKYRLLPSPAATRDAGPKKPRLPPSVDLTRFIIHPSTNNESVSRSTPPSVPPSSRTNSKASSTQRPVSLIPEWTEEDEAREAEARKANLRAAQLGWVAEDDEYETPKYVNTTDNRGKQTKIGHKITETYAKTSKKPPDVDGEIAYASDDSDYENIDSYNHEM